MPPTRQLMLSVPMVGGKNRGRRRLRTCWFTRPPVGRPSQPAPNIFVVLRLNSALSRIFCCMRARARAAVPGAPADAPLIARAGGRPLAACGDIRRPFRERRRACCITISVWLARVVDVTVATAAAATAAAVAANERGSLRTDVAMTAAAVTAEAATAATAAAVEASAFARARGLATA